jgi:hypothetical protein
MAGVGDEKAQGRDRASPSNSTTAGVGDCRRGAMASALTTATLASGTSSPSTAGINDGRRMGVTEGPGRTGQRSSSTAGPARSQAGSRRSLWPRRRGTPWWQYGDGQVWIHLRQEVENCPGMILTSGLEIKSIFLQISGWGSLASIFGSIGTNALFFFFFSVLDVYVKEFKGVYLQIFVLESLG